MLVKQREQLAKQRNPLDSQSPVMAGLITRGPLRGAIDSDHDLLRSPQVETPKISRFNLLKHADFGNSSHTIGIFNALKQSSDINENSSS